METANIGHNFADRDMQIQYVAIKQLINKEVYFF